MDKLIYTKTNQVYETIPRKDETGPTSVAFSRRLFS